MESEDGEVSISREKVRVWFLLLWFLPLFLSGAEPARIAVEGRGLLENLRMTRLLHTFLEEERKTGRISGASVEDGVVLLRSHLRRSGYLEPVLHVSLEPVEGKPIDFSLREKELPDLSLERGFQGVEFHLEPGIRYFFESVHFEGLTLLKEKEARGFFYPQTYLLELKNTRPYSPEIVRNALSNLRAEYYNRGYRMATVEVLDQTLDPSSGAVSLRVGIDSGPPHRVVEVRENLLGDPIEQARGLVRPVASLDQVFTPEWQRRRLLETRLRFYEAGYPDAKVTLNTRTGDSRDAEVLRVVAEVNIQPGPRVRTGSISWEGLNFTNREIVERQLLIESGDWLSRADLEESRRQLSGLGVFDSVRTRLDPVGGESGSREEAGVEERNVHFLMEESNRRTYYLRAGYGSYERFRGGVEITQNNLFGRAHRSKVMLRASFKSREANIQYVIPELLGSPLRWNASVDWLNREEVSFQRNELTFQTGVDTYLEALGARTRIRYQLGRLESRNINLLESVGDESTRTGSLEFNLVRDTLDNPIVPTRGYRLRWSGEVADPILGSESPYQLYEVSYAYHRVLAPGWNFHGRIHHGVLFSLNNPDSSVPFNKRFFPGGENSIRGYREGEASFRNPEGIFTGAASMTLGTLEVERVLMGDLLLVGFWDGLLQGERESDYPGNAFLHSAGIGLRFNSPVGPVRLEYGHNLKPREADPDGTLHLSLGFPF